MEKVIMNVGLNAVDMAHIATGIPKEDIIEDSISFDGDRIKFRARILVDTKDWKGVICGCK